MRAVYLTILALGLAYSHAVRLGEWEKVANYPLWVSEAQGTGVGWNSFGPQMVICGGFKDFPGVTKECYKRSFTGPRNEQWKKIAPLPTGVTHIAQASYGNLLCGAGGFEGPHPSRSVVNVWCYNVKTDVWEALPDLPAPRAGGGMTFWKRGKRLFLIFAGGVNRPNNKLSGQVDHDDTWVLDMGRKKAGWKDQKADMPDARNHMAAVNVCGRYFWVGGQHKEDERKGNRRSLSQYFPYQKKWVEKAPLPLKGGLGHISASVVPYKCGFFMIGGTTANIQKTDNVFYYHAFSDKWSFVGKFPRSVATPVCGLKKGWLMCGTGAGNPKANTAVYRARVFG